jgi:hypothetical protein
MARTAIQYDRGIIIVLDDGKVDFCPNDDYYGVTLTPEQSLELAYNILGIPPNAESLH